MGRIFRKYYEKEVLNGWDYIKNVRHLIKLLNRGGEKYEKQSEAKPHIFGVRHFSPAGAYYVREYLDKLKPKIVLIEGPSDFNDLIGEIVGKM